ncbi:hypothetical protein SCHPADRAFT_947781 [Schizopora paradoxa]|uniref:Uncharacterized protein n=1 Tax=Schizopora paradoxa TaxID=27342 RepID=A0A0H2R4C5_9AGAM|nr:hypothetical protein SCHPADRAFT_947781 [Schizopora paradoxa]
MTFNTTKVIAVKKANARRPRTFKVKVTDYKEEDLSRFIKDPMERKKYSDERARRIKEIKDLNDELRKVLKTLAELAEERKRIQELQLVYELEGMVISSPELSPIDEADEMMENMTLDA